MIKLSVPRFSEIVDQVQFIFKKRTEPYKWYDEGAITGENCVLATIRLRSSKLCLGAGRLVQGI